MPGQLLTFYAYIGHRNSKIPIITVDHYPNDWPELKQMLIEAMLKAFTEYGTTEALWSLEGHRSGKAKVWKPKIGTYILKPFNPKRSVEAYLHAVFNPITCETTIKQATFNWSHSEMVYDYMACEKNIRYKIPPVTPKTFKSFIDNPQAILEEPLIIRYPDYSGKIKTNYNKEPKQYQTSHPRTYVPWGESLREQS